MGFRHRRHALGLPQRAGPMALRQGVGQSLADAGLRPAFLARALRVGIFVDRLYFQSGIRVPLNAAVYYEAGWPEVANGARSNGPIQSHSRR
jgi:hypothetical protein